MKLSVFYFKLQVYEFNLVTVSTKKKRFWPTVPIRYYGRRKILQKTVLENSRYCAPWVFNNFRYKSFRGGYFYFKIFSSVAFSQNSHRNPWDSVTRYGNHSYIDCIIWTLNNSGILLDESWWIKCNFVR